jgi:hypothetical protein
MAKGEFINQNDMDTYAPVAVLGQTVVKTLFPDGDNPIGQYVLVNKIPFQVIGVMAEMGATPSATTRTTWCWCRFRPAASASSASATSEPSPFR